MKVIFCSLFFENPSKIIQKSKVAPNISTHNLNLNLLSGFSKFIKNDLIVINNEDYASFPGSRFFFVNKRKYYRNNILIETISKINLSIVKYIFEYLGYYRKIERIIKKYPNEKIYIVSYGRYFPNVVAINHLKKKYKRKIYSCMYLADLSGNQACQTAEYYKIKEKFSNYIVKKSVELSKQFDSFIMISEHVADFLKVSHKPTIVIEGMVDIRSIIEPEYTEKNIILYSGILSAQYGVDLLIEAISEIGNNVELHLYGDGPLKEKIVKLNISNIKFFGFITNERLRIEQSKAKILINPRQNVEEFAKYSMPSKNIEYLAAGKPVVCYKLDGIPNEYDEYFYYIKGNTVNDIKEVLEDILQIDSKELYFIGRRNQNFVIKNKSIEIQIKKILNMLLNNG